MPAATPSPGETLPELHVRLATSRAERIAAYKLITDSIAQQRQTLNRAIIFHPYTLSAIIALYGIVFTLNRSMDWGVVMLLSAGVTIAMLSMLQRWTAGMLDHAEEMGQEGEYEKWMEGEKTNTIVAVWGGRVIGCVVVRAVQDTMEVWAWTVERKYRGNEMGKDLLRSAVKLAKANGCTIKFAGEHANSFRLDNIPQIFNKRLDRDVTRAKDTLQKLWTEA